MTGHAGVRNGGVCDSPAAERNKAPILEALRRRLPATGLVLEVASGTGQHVAHFARAFPDLTFQPTEPDAALRGAIAHRIEKGGFDNVRAPIHLDVLERPWPVAEADVIVNINMLHVTAWAATRALLAGAADTLKPEGVLFVYGPFKRFGAHTAPTNEAFDARLRQQNSAWGLREAEDVEQLAADAGLTLDELVHMPANNLSLVFRR